MKAVAICPPASEEWGMCLIGHPEEVGLTLLRILFSTLSWVSELPSNYKQGGATNTCSVDNDYELGTLETHVRKTDIVLILLAGTAQQHKAASSSESAQTPILLPFPRDLSLDY